MNLFNVNSNVQIYLIYEFIYSINSYNTNIFPPLSIKVISMGMTAGNEKGNVKGGKGDGIGNKGGVQSRKRAVATATGAMMTGKRVVDRQWQQRQ
jgi:hypothetical protein